MDNRQINRKFKTPFYLKGKCNLELKYQILKKIFNERYKKINKR